MKDDLKSSTQRYLHSKQLNQEQLDELQAMLSANNRKIDKGAFKLNSAILVVIVSFVLALIIGIVIHLDENMSELIAEEVAYNHLKMKPMEVSSESLSDIREYFSELDFSITNSKFVSQSGLKLIGGRYCSIQGDAAAQLRMMHKNSGDIQIIYQAPYNKKLFSELPKMHDGEIPVRHFVNGVTVDIWVEKGILFARSFEQ